MPIDLALPPVGLIAAWGEYPLVVARGLRAAGRQVCCAAINGHADPALEQICDHVRWIPMTRIGAGLRFFHRHGVRQSTMAGKIHKVQLFGSGWLLKNFPDWRTVRIFFAHFALRRHDLADDTLLGAIVRAISADGIECRPATDFVPELLVKAGHLTRRVPSAAEMQDVLFGWRLAKELGRLDVGQTVAVRDRAVLAVEAIEGTDACIRRAGTLCQKGNFTIVKVAKPRQDMRFDVPTIGIGTLQAMVEARARVLAVEAGQTIVLGQPEVVEFADRHGLAVIALDGAAMEREAAA